MTNKESTMASQHDVDADTDKKDDQVLFRAREHPDYRSNPAGKRCSVCRESAFIVTERIKTIDDGLNDVVTGEPLCRDHY